MVHLLWACGKTAVLSPSLPPILTPLLKAWCNKKIGTSITVKCPTSVAMYGQYMRGVDRNDQFWGYYRVGLKDRKHYKYIYIHSTSPSRWCQRHDNEEFLHLACNSVNQHIQCQEEGRPSSCFTTNKKILFEALSNKVARLVVGATTACKVFVRDMRL